MNMDEKLIISAKNLVKMYQLYNSPIERLKEALHPFKKEYHTKFHALKDVSFDIYSGEAIAIIGENGAGKSTLLKILAGVLTPTAGEIIVNGRVASLLELGAGFNPEYTGVENIYLQGSLMGYSREIIAKKIDDIISFADIGTFIHQPVKMYSSGMFARLAFAVAINVEPEILIIDEALSVGDLAFQVKCFNRLSLIMESGVTILFVSHDPLAVKRITQKAIWLEDGEIKEFGSSVRVVNNYEKYLSNRDSAQEISKEAKCDLSKKLIKDFKWGEEKVRIGSGDVLITSVVINGVRQTEDSSIDIYTNSDVCIEIFISNENKDIKDINCSVVVFNGNGIYCIGLATSYDKVIVGSSVNKVICKLKKIKLLPGSYSFSISVWDKFIQIPFDLHERMYDFNVITNDVKDEGLFIQDRTWELL